MQARKTVFAAIAVGTHQPLAITLCPFTKN